MCLVLDSILEAKARSNGCHEHIIHDFTNIREVETSSLRSLWPSNQLQRAHNLLRDYLANCGVFLWLTVWTSCRLVEWVAKAIVFCTTLLLLLLDALLASFFACRVLWGFLTDCMAFRNRFPQYLNTPEILLLACSFCCIKSWLSRHLCIRRCAERRACG